MAIEASVSQVHTDQARPNDIESNNNAQTSRREPKDLHMQKRMRRLAYVTVIVMLFTVGFLVLAITVLRIRSPEFRIRAVRVESHDTENDASLRLRLGAEVSVKNLNFGVFRYEESSVEFEYRGEEIGEASIKEGKVKARLAKEMIVAAELEVEASPGLENDVKLGLLSVKSKGKLSGKVHLFNVFKKEKIVEMHCSFVIDLARKLVHDLKCD